MAWGISKKLKNVVDEEAAYTYEDEHAPSEPQNTASVQQQEEALAPVSAPIRREVENSVISKTCVVRGNIDIAEEDLVILGCVEGDIVGQGDITLSGTVNGNVSCRNFTLVCGELHGNLSCVGNAAIYAEGRLLGDIKRAENVELSGSLEGNIYVQGLTSLMSSANLDGNLTTARLKIEDGALLSGKVSVVTEEPEAEPELVFEAPAAEDAAAEPAAPVPEEPAAAPAAFAADDTLPGIRPVGNVSPVK